MDKIIAMVKDSMFKTVDGMDEIPEDKRSATVDTATDALVDGLKQYASPKNLSSLASMLGAGGHPGESQPAAEGVMGGLESKVAEALASKVGFNPSVAQKIAAAAIPAVLSLFKKRAKDNEPGFDITSLAGNRSGESDESQEGRIMDMLGGILDRKQ